MLLLFMLAMILANLGGEMYGMLLPLYLKELNASVVQIGLFFTISKSNSIGGTDPGWLDLRLAWPTTQYCNWQRGR